MTMRRPSSRNRDSAAGLVRFPIKVAPTSLAHRSSASPGRRSISAVAVMPYAVRPASRVSTTCLGSTLTSPEAHHSAARSACCPTLPGLE